MSNNRFTINKVFTELFLSFKTTQTEFGFKTDTNKNSVHDWIKHKNQIKFSKLEQMCKNLGYKVELKITKL